jgi:hypothetical protein
MQILDAWAALSPADLARLLGVPAALVVAALLPGRAVTRIAAILVALLVLRSPELGGPWIVSLGWALLWGLVAWRTGAGDGENGGSRARRHARLGLESGIIALPLGAALVALLLAALARQQFDLLDARRASVGALAVGAGVLHLMLRRHVRRAAVAFAGVGLGLELLAASARAVDPAGEGPPPGAALLATSITVGLVLRVASARERAAGSPYVSDAHDLRD